MAASTRAHGVRLGVPQLRADCLATVRQAEAAGLRVRVVRHQLGHAKAPDYNTSKIVYETPERGTEQP